MKFLVCIKQVPDVSSTVQTGRMVLNAYDASAVEAALVLSEGSDVDIHLVLIGPASASETIRKALAMGATAATHFETESGMNLDSTAVAEILAKFAGEDEYDVIACGKQAQDTDAGLTGGMLAEHLKLPFATNAVALKFSVETSPDAVVSSLLVTRQGDVGQELIRLPIPCLVTCSNDMNNPRIPSLRGIMQAKKKPITSRTVDSSVEPTTRVVAVEDPPVKPPARFIEGEPGEKVAELIRILEEETGVLE